MKAKKNICRIAKFNPIAASIILSLSIGANAAEISIKNGKISTVNGATVVDISKANAKGISHNVYDSLNVDKGGLIFNNSKNGANTTLAGQINGNSNLSSGSAKVILNEVTSTKQSALNGVMEVAGDKAHLIIANPNGISCQSCGFINTDKVTVTTGKPEVQSDGSLKGYSVNGGIVTVGQMQSSSPTEILARSVVVNGMINAAGQDLSIVTGNNYVNANGQVTGSVTAKGKSTYGIDVAKLGGMYANRINLVSTENGIGVRNIGAIAGGLGGIQINSNGKLINDNGQIKSSGTIDVKTNGALTNVTGKIMSDGIVSINTNKNVITNTNTGQIASGYDVYINSGAINNTNGKLAAGNVLAVDTNKNTLTNYGQGVSVGIEAGAVALNTGNLMNDNGQIKGYYVGIQATNIDTDKAIIDSAGNVEMISAGYIQNNNGLIRSAGGDVNLAAVTLVNSKTKTADAASSDSLGIVAGHDVVIATEKLIDNRVGQIISGHDVSLKSKADVNNANGKLASHNEILIDALNVNNSQAGLSGKQGVTINAVNNIVNDIGVISSEEGDVNLKGKAVNNNNGFIMGDNLNINSATWVSNLAAFMVANDKLTINAGSYVNNDSSENKFSSAGLYFGMPQQKGGIVGRGGVDITAKTYINNESSRIVAVSGAVKLNSDILYNAKATIAGGYGETTYIKARDLRADNSTIYSAADLKIDANTLSLKSSGALANNTAAGIITTDKNLELNINGNFTNNGWINSNGDSSINVTGTLNNNKIFNSNSALNVKSNVVNNYMYMGAGTALTVTGMTINNNNSTSKIVAPVVSIVANGDIKNWGDIVSDIQLTEYTSAGIYNYKNMLSNGIVQLNSKTVYNNGAGAVLGGLRGTQVSGKITGTGSIVGL
ncbi:MAG: filamentous hemagglutinin N-terminal domain-containing protein [Enterobacteriaceae bacterium]|jgi:filamentous hemagglutinin family protein|nr:filamentous hemagglutinin N-terminal domain-containing protein [Enterobacteriaceae bacterium]